MAPAEKSRDVRDARDCRDRERRLRLAQEAQRKRRWAEIAAYAQEHAGTDLDLDRDLEAAGIKAIEAES